MLFPQYILDTRSREPRQLGKRCAFGRQIVATARRYRRIVVPVERPRVR
jgi:hypothetical protein